MRLHALGSGPICDIRPACPPPKRSGVKITRWMSAICCRAIRAPTLVLHRTSDRWVPLAHGRYLAEHIPGAKLVELPGDDHIPYWGDQERLVGEIQEFLTGARGIPTTDRVLLTMLVTDI